MSFVTSAAPIKAAKDNVLGLDNTTEFTPSAPHQPATKKYVDDVVVAAASSLAVITRTEFEALDTSGFSVGDRRGVTDILYGNATDITVLGSSFEFSPVDVPVTYLDMLLYANTLLLTNQDVDVQHSVIESQTRTLLEYNPVAQEFTCYFKNELGLYDSATMPLTLAAHNDFLSIMVRYLRIEMTIEAGFPRVRIITDAEVTDVHHTGLAGQGYVPWEYSIIRSDALDDTRATDVNHVTLYDSTSYINLTNTYTWSGSSWLPDSSMFRQMPSYNTAANVIQQGDIVKVNAFIAASTTFTIADGVTNFKVTDFLGKLGSGVEITVDLVVGASVTLAHTYDDVELTLIEGQWTYVNYRDNTRGVV